jgi:hypothetical protein
LVLHFIRDYYAAHGLPDGRGMPGEALCIGVMPDMQQTPGTTADKGYMADNPNRKQLNLNGILYNIVLFCACYTIFQEFPVYTLFENCMKTVFFGFIAVLFFMITTGCSKELSLETNKDSVIIIVPDTTYQPLETPSFWIYQDSATGITDTLRATDSTVNINSKLYTLFHNSSAGQTADEYFNISAHNYYSYGSFASGDTIELLYLNDTASPGYNWQATAGTVNGFPAQVQGQIIDTGLTVTIGSNTFTHVIHSEIDIEYNVGSGFQTPYAIYDYYVAKAVGIIRIEENFPSIPYTAASNLISYKIQ